MTMTKPINIVFQPDPSTPAPLFAHYQGQALPQPAYVTLNLNTGEVDAQVSGEVGGGMPDDVWHGVVRRYPIRPDMTGAQALSAISSIEDTLQEIYDNSELVMMDGNWVGQLNESGETAENTLPELIGTDLEGGVITDLKAWLAESDDSAWLPEEGDDINAFIEEVNDGINADGYTAAEDVEDCLLDMWANRLYNGDSLPSNVAKALLTDGRCADSAWVAELNEYASKQHAGEQQARADT